MSTGRIGGIGECVEEDLSMLGVVGVVRVVEVGLDDGSEVTWLVDVDDDVEEVFLLNGVFLVHNFNLSGVNKGEVGIVLMCFEAVEYGLGDMIGDC